jgi:pilus assembly protein CpaE
VTETAGGASNEDRAKVIHMIPTAGGCGSTTIACNVAAGLARSHKTLLIDLDLIRGSVASALDLRPKYTIADIMDDATHLDGALLDNAITVHKASGLSVLARPAQPEESQRVTRAGLLRLLSLASRRFDYVVIDSLMSFDPLYLGAVQSADVNVLVMQLNVPAAKNAERFVSAIRRMGVDPNKVKVVANRFVRKGYDLAPQDVEKKLGLKIAWKIPNDFKNAIAAINYGEPVVLRTPRAEMAGSLCGLMGMLNGRTAKVAPAPAAAAAIPAAAAPLATVPAALAAAVAAVAAGSK